MPRSPLRENESAAERKTRKNRERQAKARARKRSLPVNTDNAAREMSSNRANVRSHRARMNEDERIEQRAHNTAIQQSLRASLSRPDAEAANTRHAEMQAAREGRMSWDARDEIRERNAASHQS